MTYMTPPLPRSPDPEGCCVGAGHSSRRRSGAVRVDRPVLPGTRRLPSFQPLQQGDEDDGFMTVTPSGAGSKRRQRCEHAQGRVLLVHRTTLAVVLLAEMTCHRLPSLGLAWRDRARLPLLCAGALGLRPGLRALTPRALPRHTLLRAPRRLPGGGRRQPCCLQAAL